MYVACPSCQSLFQIQPAHLRAARGEVRCGVCQNSFNASGAVFEDGQQALAWAEQQVAREIDDLVDKALDQVPGSDAFSAEDSGAGASPAPQPSPPDEEVPALDERAANTAAEAEENRPDVAAEAVAGAAGEDRPRAGEAWRFHADADFYAQPISAEFSLLQQSDSDDQRALPGAAFFVDDFGGALHRTDWWSIAAALFLTLLLLGQYTFVERYRLASNTQLRPALEVFCGLLGCDLPLRRDIGRVEVVEREVRDHPNVSDAVLISAAFVNRAPFRQVYPVFQISFSDVSGTPVALRRFRPDEYLDAGKDPSTGMAPGEEARLMLEVIDPGVRAVSYQFEFL
jgi:predicted Zn finger-like uncharacterized protein